MAITVHTDFDNGSASAWDVDQHAQRVTLQPAARHGDLPLFFHVRIDGVDVDRPLTIDVSGHHPPARHTCLAWSTDGVEWRRSNMQSPPYELDVDHPTVWVARNIPFGCTDLATLIDDLVDHPRVTVSSLCQSEGGRDVPVLVFADHDGHAESLSAARPISTIWVQARLHAFESHSSRVAASLCRWLAAAPEADALLRRTQVVVAPIMDIDGVAAGDSGKDRNPVDFNRDWHASPHWRVVQAAIDRIDAVHAAAPLTMLLDLHSPWFYEPHHWHTVDSLDPKPLGRLLDHFDLAMDNDDRRATWASRVSFGYLREIPTNSVPFAAARWLHNRDNAIAATMEISHDHDELGRPIGVEQLDAYGRALGQALGQTLSQALS